MYDEHDDRFDILRPRERVETNTSKKLKHYSTTHRIMSDVLYDMVGGDVHVEKCASTSPFGFILLPEENFVIDDDFCTDFIERVHNQAVSSHRLSIKRRWNGCVEIGWK